MIIKYAIALAVIVVLAAILAWAFIPSRHLPGNRARHLRIRLHLRLHPGKGFAHIFSLWLRWGRLASRLRAVIEAKDAENAVLRAELGAQRERYRRLELRVAELERRLGSDSTTSGMPPSKDPIGARERRTAERKAGSLRNGTGARTADVAGSRGIPGRGCRGTRTRTSGRTCRRRRGARGAGPPWTARTGRAAGGLRSGTCASRRS
jgi:hypothetical protein